MVLFFIYTKIASGKSYEGVCGGSTFLIKESVSREEAPKIYYKVRSEKKEKFLYEASSEYLEVACVKNFDDKEYLLLEEMCGGSGCSDFGEYRIIDPISKKIVLGNEPFTSEDEVDVSVDEGNMADHIRVFNHEKRNRKAAQKILGYNPPLLKLFVKKLCCSNNE